MGKSLLHPVVFKDLWSWHDHVTGVQMNIAGSAAVEPVSNSVAATPSAVACVLVIDDEKIVCDTLSALLKAEGFDVVTARSGAMGVELLHSRLFDAVIADLVMPGMDGIERIAALKAVAPHIEVIILTGHATVESTIETFRQGACDFLLKPIDMAQLRAALTKAVALQRRSVGTPLSEPGLNLLTAPDRNELIPAILKCAKRTVQANMAGLALGSVRCSPLGEPWRRRFQI
jgi:DNA-binding response OmpR family regulator